MDLSRLPFLPLEERDKYYDAELRRMVNYAYENAPSVKLKFDLASVKPSDIRSKKDLEKLPITSKEDLMRSQAENPPFGGFLTKPAESFERIFVSPGPLYDVRDPKDGAFMTAFMFSTLGLTKGDRVINTFSYHLVPAGLILDAGLRKAGCTVIPAGTGSSELQLRIMRDLKVAGYAGTPSYLNILIKKAEESGYDFRRDFQLRFAMFIGEKLSPSLRKNYEENYGLQVRESYASGDVGVLGYECEKKSGMHMAEGAIIEIVDPTTLKQLGPGETGEVVVTPINETCPFIRFGTGDLSYYSDEPCACGRTAPRFIEIVGRVGEVIKIKGMFIYPSQVKNVMNKFPQVKKFQLVVNRINEVDSTTLQLEVEDGVDKKIISDGIQKSFPEICTIRVNNLDFVAPGTISPEGKTIVDLREWK